MIPKIIWDIWLGDEPPEIVKKCLLTHSLDGYETRHISLENCYTGSRFVQDALKAKRYVKGADYLRMYYLNTYGGYYLDGDLELTTRLDDLDDGKTQLITCQEANGLFATAFVASTPNNPILAEYLRRLDANFRGDGDLTFESGVRAFADLIWIGYGGRDGVRILPPGDFYQEPFSRGRHWFLNSWL